MQPPGDRAAQPPVPGQVRDHGQQPHRRFLIRRADQGPGRDRPVDDIRVQAAWHPAGQALLPVPPLMPQHPAQHVTARRTPVPVPASASSTASSAAACTTRTTASGSASPEPGIRAGDPAQRRERRQRLGEHRALIGRPRPAPARPAQRPAIRSLASSVQLSGSCRHHSPALRASSRIRRHGPPAPGGRRGEHGRQARPRLGVVRDQQHRHAARTRVADRVSPPGPQAPTTTASPGPRPARRAAGPAWSSPTPPPPSPAGPRPGPPRPPTRAVPPAPGAARTGPPPPPAAGTAPPRPRARRRRDLRTAARTRLGRGQPRRAGRQPTPAGSSRPAGRRRDQAR